MGQLWEWVPCKVAVLECLAGKLGAFCTACLVLRRFFPSASCSGWTSSASLAQDCNQSICSIELVADTLSNLQTYSTPIAMYMEPPSAVMGKRTAPMPALICTEGPAIDAVKEVAQASLSSQSTAVEWSRGLHDFVRCESVDTTEPHSPASSGKSEDFGIDHEPLEFGVLQFGTVLSKERALELQQALLQAFSSPGFQKKLHGVARRYRASHGNDPNCWSDFKELVRSYQADIIPSYGFEASGRGVRAMLQAFQPFENDPDIYVNATAINEALFSIMNRPDTSKDHVTSIGFGRKPVTNVAIMEMLQNLIIAFSCPSFQEDIRKLQRRADCNARRAEDPNGYYHLPGRADLALPLQQKTLKKYGFMANKQGVRDMVLACVPYLSNPEVAKTFDAVNMHLGRVELYCSCMQGNKQAHTHNGSIKFPEQWKRKITQTEPSYITSYYCTFD